MDRIILFGGSFDPIHNGHLEIASFALKTLGAKKVIFIPAKNPCWKKPTPIEDRLNLVQLALKGKDNFELSTYEIESKEETNYTYDTVKHFKLVYPNDELYFLIGFDQVNQLDRWKNIDELSSLIHFLAVYRPIDDLNKENINKYHLTVLEGLNLSVSSTLIRELKSLDLPLPCIKYILDKELYFVPKVKSYLKTSRYLHSVSVAYTAYDIAEANKLNKYDAFLAGYLHDVGKYAKIEKYEDIVKKLYSKYFPFGIPNWVYHQFIGKIIVQNDFKILDEDILESIEFHTTGKRNMSALDKIIFAADKIEPTRGFDSSDLINSMKKDYEKGFIEVLKANREYLVSHNSYVQNEDLLTKECYDYYLKGEEK